LIEGSRVGVGNGVKVGVGSTIVGEGVSVGRATIVIPGVKVGFGVFEATTVGVGLSLEQPVTAIKMARAATMATARAWPYVLVVLDDAALSIIVPA